MGKKLTTGEWINQARLKYGDKFDYSKVEYSNSKAKVTITCPVHGDFEQTPSRHIQSQHGCSYCGIHADKKSPPNKKSTNEWMTDIESVHGDTYSYPKFNPKNAHDSISIQCKHHGLFNQKLYSHVDGHGCPSCAATHKNNSRDYTNHRISFDEFLNRARLIHGDKYSYDMSDWFGIGKKIKITCPDHGEFYQIPSNHTHKGNMNGCPKCSNSGPSRAECEIFNMVKLVCSDAIQSDREQLDGLELDIYIPSSKLAIEYNGTYWHSEQYKDKKYHQEKFLKCREKGIQLFQIWEHDFVDPVKRRIIWSMLCVKLGLAKRVFARKTTLRECGFKVVKAFYNANHLQGVGQCHSNQIHHVLEFEGDIVMAMSVDPNKNYITRVCSVMNTVVVGGASKLFKTLNKDTEYTTYGSNDLGGRLTHYQNAKQSMTEPRYFWWKTGEMIQRKTVQKHQLSTVYPDYDGSSEVTWMQSIGYVRVFDSGNTKLTFKT